MAKKKTEEKKIEEVYAKQGDKIDVEKCPKCNSELIVQTKEGTEVLECEGCKFVKEKKARKKKVEEKKTETEEKKPEEKKEESKQEEFPNVELGFDPFAQQ
jgi:DNA-directed RNA polymerase subunit M/transcription elongation factor TFIIS